MQDTAPHDPTAPLRAARCCSGSRPRPPAGRPCELGVACACLPVAAAEQRVRDGAGENRQPVRRQSVEQRCENRLCRSHAGQRERAREAGFDEPQPAGRDRDHREQRRSGVREERERRFR